MTELARRVLDARPWRSAAGNTGGPPSMLYHQPIRVQISLPGELYPAFADGLTSALHGQVSALLAELGIHRGLAVSHHWADAGVTAVMVSIDQRPVTYLRGEQLSADDGVEALLQKVMSGILRRLPLMVGASAVERSVLVYLTGLGCRVPVDAITDGFDVDAAERLIDDRAAEKIVLEVAEPTLRRVDRDGARAVIELRETEFSKRGIVYPDLQVVPTDDRPGSVRVRLNDVTLPMRRLGPEAGWTDVVAHLGAELAKRRHWFVRQRDVSRAMTEDLVLFFPDLVAITEANYSHAQVSACMRELSRSGWRTRNFSRILWLLLELGGAAADADILRLDESPLLPKARHRQPAEQDPIVMAVRVRKLVAEERWRLGTYTAPQHAVRLAAGIEERLVAGGQPEELARTEWAAVRAFRTFPGADRVVTRTVEAIGPVRDALQALENAPRVVASHELPPDAGVSAFPVLTDPDGEK